MGRERLRDKKRGRFSGNEAEREGWRKEGKRESCKIRPQKKTHKL